MATFNLINTIKFGASGSLKSGSTINSLSEDVVKIAASGGLLVATGLSTLLDEAAATVQLMWRGGASPEACDAAMLAAYSAYIASYEVAHDHVDNESAHTHAIATTGASSPVITCAKQRMQQNLGVLPAPGVNYVAQFAAGAPIDSAGPFARFVPPRTCMIARGGAGVATVYTVTGTDADGAVLTETINAPGAGPYQGTRAFATVTRFQSDVNPTVTTDLQTGNGFGLGCAASDIDVVGLDGGAEAPTSTHAATGTVVPGTAPNAVHTYAVDYRVLPTATNAAHDHGAATGAGSAHNHTLS